MSDTPFLNVTHSCMGKKWVLKEADERMTLCLAQQFGVPEIVARLLSARGITPETAEDFLNPTLKKMMPDPSHLIDMDKGVERVAAAIKAGDTVAIFGDYDVDGATSSALLKSYLQAIGATVLVHIPDRIKEGYGPNVPAFEKLKDQGAKVIITVDCGTNAFEPIAAAKEMGLDVIVLDHHVAEPKLPDAYAVINPNRLDEASEQKHLAAVGLSFLFVAALNRYARQQGWFEREIAEPNLIQLLDMVALGTVCDVVSLTGLNRAYVSQGLKIMQRRQNLGLTTLSDTAGVNERLSAYHAGFVLGPRINAGGRVGKADLGIQLLSSKDPSQTLKIAKQLEALNKERQDIEAFVLQEAIDQTEGSDAHVAIASNQNWHPGVIGIVAGRLKEQYSKPACVISMENGIGKGSGRSVPGIDLGSIIHNAKQQGLLEAGGGHAMAGGFTVLESNLDAFKKYMNETIAKKMTEIAYTPSLTIDAALTPRAVSMELLTHLERLAPFGAGNPSPKFAFSNVRVAFSKIVGSNHVKCTLQGEDGAKLDAIAFRCADHDLGQTLLSTKKNLLHVAGTLKADTWMGRITIKLYIDDVAEAG